MPIKLPAGPVEQDVARQREAVGVQPGGGHRHEDVAIAEADSERPKLSGRAARALAVQARRQLKQKLGQLKDQRQKIAKKSIARRDERKALGAKIKAAFAVSKNNKGDAEAVLQAVDNLPDDDDDNDDWADDDVEMAMMD